MGGFFGKKKQDKPAPAARGGSKRMEEASPRKSVRRVVPGAGKGPSSASAPSAARPAASSPPSTPHEDAIDLPDIETAPAEAASPPTAAAGKQQDIAAPHFAGSLQAAEPQGPSRTGDRALLDFLTGTTVAGEQRVELITHDQAAAARAKAESEQLPLDVALVQLGFVTEEALVNALSQATFVPHLKVDKYEIRKKALDTISRADAERYGVFPVDKLGNLLTLAMVNPLDTEALRQLENKTGLDIKKVVATRSEIATAIDKYYGGKVAASEQSRSFTQDRPEEIPVTPAILDVPSVGAPSSSPTAAPAAAAVAPVDVAPEIQDLDDLLSGGDEVAPSIIEPVSIAPEAPGGEDLFEAPITAAPSPASAPAASAPTEPEFAFADAPKSGTGALQRADTDLDLDLGEAATAKPAAAAPAPAAGRGAPSPEPAAPPQAAAASPAPVAAKPSVEPVAAAIPSAAAVGVRSAAPARVIDLMPVSEDEFRNAVRHGKAKPFERWVALQTRSRVLNAVMVEKELDPLLAGLYAAAQRVA